MNLVLSRCKQCAEQHKKCDRQLPSCNRCLLKYLECSYLEECKYIKRKETTEINLINFKINDKGSKSRSNKIKKTGRNIKSMNRPEVTLLSGRMIQITSPFGIMKLIPRINLIENLLALIQYPSLKVASTDLGLIFKLIDKLNLLATKRKTSFKEIIPKRPETIDRNNILKQAIINYFKYNNNILPIFIEESFIFSEKPLVLRLSIMVSGLMWMEENEATKYLISFISFHLSEKLYLIQHIKPSLENLQTLLILMTGFYSSPWISRLRPLYLTFCSRVSSMLGLHLSNIKSNSKMEIERAMTYSCLNIIRLFFFINSDLSIDEVHIITKFELLHVLQSKKFTNNLISKPFYKPCNSFIIHSFYTNLSLIIFIIGSLKANSLISKLTSEHQFLKCLTVINKLDQLQGYFLDLISQTCPYPDVLTDLHRFVLFTCHSLKFVLHSIRFYHTNNSYLKDQIDFSAVSSLINSALIECKNVIEIGSLLPHHYHLLVGIAHISQCIIFLVRYKEHSNLDYQSVINKGLDFLKSIKSPLSVLAKFNIHFISLIQGHIQLQIKLN